jgi:hypothetical protein
MTGAGILEIVMVIVFVVVSKPSVALTVRAFGPSWLVVGDQRNTPVVVLKVEPAGSVGALSVTTSLSGSVASAIS